MTVNNINTRKLIPTSDQTTNMTKLAEAITRLEGICGKEFVVTSGLRSEQAQSEIDPEHPGSAHIEGMAVDIHDPDASLFHWLIENNHYLLELGLYLENTGDNSTHVHLQTRPTQSRIFTA